MTAGGGVRVERLGTDGDGVIADPCGLVFVRTGLPGDVVTLGKPRRDGKISRADLKRVIEPSPDRVSSPCAIAPRCGGCPLMSASPALSARFKEGLVRHALGDEVAFRLERPEPSVGYRTRARLSFAGRALGYLGPGSRSVLDVDHCAVLVPSLDAALGWVRAAVLPLLKGAGELHLGVAEREDDGLAPVLALRTGDPQAPALYQLLERAVADGTLRGAQADIAGARARLGDPTESSRDVDGRRLEVPVGGFRQAHLAANRMLGEAVLRLGAPTGKRVLELHAGHGNFTLPLAQRATSVAAVELGEEAVRALLENLQRHGLSAAVHGGDALPYVGRARKGTFDLVVLDPPRTGAKELIAPLLKLAPDHILYVSCAPGTLGRDLGMLRDGGYRVIEAQAFDLFPRTAHVETIVALERRS